MPRSTAKVLRQAGFECFDVRDIGLKGAGDDVIYDWAQKEDCIILTGDLGFSNTLRFSIGTHKGIVIVRFPNEMSTGTINKLLENMIVSIRNDLSGNLTIIEPNKIRIRRRKG
jgi:predicted nuclease of predicted toxin-antitoxin system